MMMNINFINVRIFTCFVKSSDFANITTITPPRAGGIKFTTCSKDFISFGAYKVNIFDVKQPYTT